MKVSTKVAIDLMSTAYLIARSAGSETTDRWFGAVLRHLNAKQWQDAIVQVPTAVQGSIRKPVRGLAGLLIPLIDCEEFEGAAERTSTTELPYGDPPHDNVCGDRASGLVCLRPKGHPPGHRYGCAEPGCLRFAIVPTMLCEVHMTDDRLPDVEREKELQARDVAERDEREAAAHKLWLAQRDTLYPPHPDEDARNAVIEALDVREGGHRYYQQGPYHRWPTLAWTGRKGDTGSHEENLRFKALVDLVSNCMSGLNVVYRRPGPDSEKP